MGGRPWRPAATAVPSDSAQQLRLDVADLVDVMKMSSQASQRSGGERTRTADFHVANVFAADFGGLRRTITAGQRVIHTPANGCERRRPRDGRGMRGLVLIVLDELRQGTNGSLELGQVLGDCRSHDRV